MSDEPVMVPNPLKAQLAEAVRQARRVAEECGEALDEARRVMRGGAWESRVADGFYTELTAVDRDAVLIARHCVDALEAARASAPAQVELSVPAWQYRPAG